MKFELGNPKDLIGVMILLFITSIFACGGIALGCLFNYITTGVWFI